MMETRIFGRVLFPPRWLGQPFGRERVDVALYNDIAQLCASFVSMSLAF